MHTVVVLVQPESFVVRNVYHAKQLTIIILSNVVLVADQEKIQGGTMNRYGDTRECRHCQGTGKSSAECCRALYEREYGKRTPFPSSKVKCCTCHGTGIVVLD